MSIQGAHFVFDKEIYNLPETRFE